MYTRYDSPVIGIFYWTGPLTWLAKSVLNLNCRLFDEVIAICDFDTEFIQSRTKVTQIPSEELQYHISYRYGHEVIGARASDILCYFSWEFIESQGIMLSPNSVVVYFDLDYIITNRRLLAAYSQSVTDFVCLYDEALYWNCGNSHYRNVGLSFSTSTNKSDKVLKFIDGEIKKRLDSGSDKYTLLGPSLANLPEVSIPLDTRPVGRESSKTLKPDILTEGTVSIPLSDTKLGVHLTVSDIRSFGFNIIDVTLEDGQLKLKVEDNWDFIK